MAAVLHERFPCLVPMHRLVLPECGQQISERLDRNVEALHRPAKRDEDRMRYGACITLPQLLAPPSQRLECNLRIRNLIGQIICPAAEGINVIEVLPEITRQ